VRSTCSGGVVAAAAVEVAAANVAQDAPDRGKTNQNGRVLGITEIKDRGNRSDLATRGCCNRSTIRGGKRGRDRLSLIPDVSYVLE
jgi:hypothetical protein